MILNVIFEIAVNIQLSHYEIICWGISKVYKNLRKYLDRK